MILVEDEGEIGVFFNGKKIIKWNGKGLVYIVFFGLCVIFDVFLY